MARSAVRNTVVKVPKEIPEVRPAKFFCTPLFLPDRVVPGWLPPWEGVSARKGLILKPAPDLNGRLHGWSGISIGTCPRDVPNCCASLLGAGPGRIAGSSRI